MRPLKPGLSHWYWSGERCIDRLHAFAKRVTRDKPMTSGEVRQAAYRVAIKLISPPGAAVSLRTFERDLGFQYRDDDVIRNGKNVSQNLREKQALAQKDKKKIEAMNQQGVDEAISEGRCFEDVLSHQYKIRYGLITRNKRMIKRETAAIKEIRKLSREIKSLLKEQENA